MEQWNNTAVQSQIMVSRVDTHPQRDRIDQELLSGVAFRSISAWSHVSIGALSRYRARLKQTLGLALKQRSQDERLEHGVSLLSRIESLITEGQDICAKAKADKKYAAASNALNSVARSLELIGKLTGELQTPANAGGIHLTLNRTTNTIINSYGDSDPEWATMLFEATRGFDPVEITRLKAIAETQLRENGVILPAQTIES
jgi:hypothetical protein